MADAIPDAYGVYMEAIRYNPEDSVAPFRSHIKLFLAENMVATSCAKKARKPVAGRGFGTTTTIRPGPRLSITSPA